jgi:hypothetical protein
MTNDEALSFLVTLGATKWQYTNGVPNVEANHSSYRNS